MSDTMIDQAMADATAPDPEAPVSRWSKILAPVVSLSILGAVVWQLRGLDLANLWALLPRGIGFWLVFLLYYMAGPVADWVIFRRLWGLPLSGFVPLLRKLVGNELLLGYIGEVYFYAWARRHMAPGTAPFGAIKDVTILSALVGNGTTLAMVLVAAPLVGSLDMGISGSTLLWSIGLVIGLSLLLLLLRRQLFTLPAPTLWMISGVHLLRTIASTVLAALMWHLMLPTVAVRWWLVLSTLRLLVARLPLLPNKDLVFAGLAALLVGKGARVAEAMTLMATLILAAHLLVGMVLGAAGLIAAARRR